MRRLEAFLRFLWDFVVGDDWRTAVGVALALGVTAVAAGAGLTAWWIMPVGFGFGQIYMGWLLTREAESVLAR